MPVAAQSDEYGTVTPYFTVEDADRLIEFATQVFEAELVKINRYEDGTIQHARLRIGDTVISTPHDSGIRIIML